MKLNILGIGDARAGAIGHRQSIAASARRICSVAIDSSQAARRQHCRSRKVTMNGPLLPIKHVGAVTGDRAVVLQRIARVMRESNQIDSRHVRLDGDIGTVTAKQRSGHP